MKMPPGGRTVFAPIVKLPNSLLSSPMILEPCAARDVTVRASCAAVTAPRATFAAEVSGAANGDGLAYRSPILAFIHEQVRETEVVTKHELKVVAAIDLRGHEVLRRTSDEWQASRLSSQVQGAEASFPLAMSHSSSDN